MHPAQAASVTDPRASGAAPAERGAGSLSMSILGSTTSLPWVTVGAHGSSLTKLAPCCGAGLGLEPVLAAVCDSGRSHSVPPCRLSEHWQSCPTGREPPAQVPEALGGVTGPRIE